MVTQFVGGVNPFAQQPLHVAKVKHKRIRHKPDTPHADKYRSKYADRFERMELGVPLMCERGESHAIGEVLRMYLVRVGKSDHRVITSTRPSKDGKERVWIIKA